MQLGSVRQKETAVWLMVPVLLHAGRFVYPGCLFFCQTSWQNNNVESYGSPVLGWPRHHGKKSQLSKETYSMTFASTTRGTPELPQQG